MTHLPCLPAGHTGGSRLEFGVLPQPAAAIDWRICSECTGAATTCGSSGHWTRLLARIAAGDEDTA